MMHIILMFNIDHMTDGQSDLSQPINNKNYVFTSSISVMCCSVATE